MTSLQEKVADEEAASKSTRSSVVFVGDDHEFVKPVKVFIHVGRLEAFDLDRRYDGHGDGLSRMRVEIGRALRGNVIVQAALNAPRAKRVGRAHLNIPREDARITV